MTLANPGSGTAQAQEEKIWMTLTGLPLAFRFQWPFHKSTSGADFWVLHGDIRLINTEGLYALVAVNLSATVRDVVPSLERNDVEAPVINALRKEVDRRQIEFAKSGKLLPVAFSSRHYDFKRSKWVFGKASDEAIAEFIARKVYWQTKMAGEVLGSAQSGQGAPLRVWLGDPTEAQYLETSPGHLVELACRLVEAQGLIRTDGEFAAATPELMAHAVRFETAMRTALEELEKKHAFERG